MYIDKKRHLVLLVVFFATVISELAWLTNIWGKRVETDARDKGAFFYNIFRYFNLLSWFIMYLPATWAIEVYGVNRAITIGMSLCSFGMWVTVNDYYTFGSIFIALGHPFIINSVTKVSASWYGPKGRTFASMILILARLLPGIAS